MSFIQIKLSGNFEIRILSVPNNTFLFTTTTSDKFCGFSDKTFVFYSMPN